MRRIRVLFVLTSPVRGGMEKVVLALLQRLDPREFHLALAAPGPVLGALAPDLAGVSVDVLAVEVENWLRWQAVRKLNAFISRLQPDVVNLHLVRSTSLVARLARWRRVPAVVTTYHGREGWRRGGRRGSFLPDRLVARSVDRVITVSQAARNFLVHGKGFPPGKVVVVPNGRDLSAFEPGAHREAVREELGLDPSTPLVGVVGRLVAQKGHRYLVEAWPDVIREFPDARLLVVGDGSLRAELEAQARQRGVARSLIFTGFRPDIPRLLDAMDVIALPSLSQGMALSAIEAAAMARPVVATAVDMAPEVVREGITGLLVPPADPGALAHALVRLLGDPVAAREMGTAARAWALERFDLQRQVETTAEVYRAAVARAAHVRAA
jgi:glycosyltransferase involved in cell wall biosynthesis